MAVTEDRKFTKEQVYTLLEGAKGKTLGEVDKSHQFARTLESKKNYRYRWRRDRTICFRLQKRQ